MSKKHKYTIFIGAIFIVIFAYWIMRPNTDGSSNEEWDKDKYYQLIEKYHQDGDRGSFNEGYMIEPGPPLRAVFLQPGGLLDNWQGIVYDPSGLVEETNEFKRDWTNWDDPSLQEAKKLFGGDIFRCEKLEDDWYLCFFT